MKRRTHTHAHTLSQRLIPGKDWHRVLMRGDLSLKSLGDSTPAARAIVVKLMRHGNTMDNIVNELIEAYGAWGGQ